jgi:hypothetical protein
MKNLFIIFAAAAIGAVMAFSIVSRRDASCFDQARAAWAAEKSRMKAELQKQPQRVVIERAVTNSVPVLVEVPPQEILDDLLALKPGGGNDRNPVLRKVVYKLELLVSRGEAALPAIHEFVGKNIDVSYEPLTVDAPAGTNAAASDNAFGPGSRRGGQRGWFARGEARRARDLANFGADWVAPPTLRIGVIGVLKEMGGAGAEQELAYMLSTTGRGVEVAYLAVTLDKMAPGKYRDAAVAAAKELLMTPPGTEKFDRLDSLSRSYLYGVLEYCKDTSFAVNAQQVLVGPDGRLDPDALDYLSKALKEQSAPALYAAYQNPALTNQMDKMDLGRELLTYVGQNAQANQFFAETLQSRDIDPRAKMFVVAQLAGGGFGPFATEPPQDPQVVQNRIQMLNSIQPQYADDEQLTRVIGATIDSLRSGQPVDFRQLFGGGRRGFGGFGGGGGN